MTDTTPDSPRRSYRLPFTVPTWLIYLMVFMVVASWIPLALIARARASKSHKPRVQANPRVFTQTKEFHDQAKLSVTLEALNVNNKRPIAGAYTDTFTITLGTV